VRDESEIKLKRAYWQGFYYSLNPTEKSISKESEKAWLIAHVWLTALDWVLGQATDSGTTLREIGDAGEWSL
jgi:hypothetical protein